MATERRHVAKGIAWAVGWRDVSGGSGMGEFLGASGVGDILEDSGGMSWDRGWSRWRGEAQAHSDGEYGLGRT